MNVARLKIHWLYPQQTSSTKEYREYNTRQHLLGSVEYPFIAITSRSTRTQNSVILSHAYTCIYMQNNSQWHNDKGRAKTSLKKICTSHFIVTFVCERELETEQRLQYIDPTLMAISVVSFSFSWCSTGGPGAQLSAGFLYHILSPTGLRNYRGSSGPLQPGVAFPTTSCLWRLWSPTVWLPVLTELYNSSTPTQSPTQSLEWHVWSSSSGNNCHAVHRSLSSGASVYECIMGFYLVPFHQPNPPTRSLSITGHWNVSFPPGASLWNGMFARAEGQYITIVVTVRVPSIDLFKNYIR